MVYSEILTAIIDMAQQYTETQIVAGSLPVGNGYTMTYTVATPDELFRNRSSNYRLSVVFNGKSTNQQTLMDEMQYIHEHLTRAYNYPSAVDWQVYAIDTESGPTYLGREDTGMWLYGSSLTIKFYWRNNNA